MLFHTENAANNLNPAKPLTQNATNTATHFPDIDLKKSRKAKLTDQMAEFLISCPQGASRIELLEHFYPGYRSFSPRHRDSLSCCLKKLLQRTRSKYKSQGILIYFCRNHKKWFAEKQNPWDLNH